MKIFIDDSPIDIVDKINTLLESYGLKIEFDEEVLDEAESAECKITKII